MQRHWGDIPGRSGTTARHHALEPNASGLNLSCVKFYGILVAMRLMHLLRARAGAPACTSAPEIAAIDDDKKEHLDGQRTTANTTSNMRIAPQLTDRTESAARPSSYPLASLADQSCARYLTGTD
jgi:hypothetical protein